jgi:hypothetical protein
VCVLRLSPHSDLQAGELRRRYTGDSRVVVHDDDGAAGRDGASESVDERDGALNTDALIVLSDGGTAALAREWGNVVDCWKKRIPQQSRDSPRVVVLLVECPAVEEAEALATRMGTTVRETHNVWCQSRQFTVVVADAVYPAVPYGG